MYTREDWAYIPEEASELHYYANLTTGHTQWEPPAALLGDGSAAVTSWAAVATRAPVPAPAHAPAPAPAPRPPKEKASSQWVQHTDEASGQTYYYHAVTMETAWSPRRPLLMTAATWTGGGVAPLNLPEATPLINGRKVADYSGTLSSSAWLTPRGLNPWKPYSNIIPRRYLPAEEDDDEDIDHDTLAVEKAAAAAVMAADAASDGAASVEKWKGRRLKVLEEILTTERTYAQVA